MPVELESELVAVDEFDPPVAVGALAVVVGLALEPPPGIVEPDVPADGLSSLGGAGWCDRVVARDL